MFIFVVYFQNANITATRYTIQMINNNKKKIYVFMLWQKFNRWLSAALHGYSPLFSSRLGDSIDSVIYNPNYTITNSCYPVDMKFRLEVDGDIVYQADQILPL